MIGSAFKVQGSMIHPFRTPISVVRNFSGFSYIALLVAIIIIGISLGAAGKYWSNVMLRDKEEELLFRGGQYQKAIDQYYSIGRQFPPSIDDLLKDPRSAVGKRHLRQKFKDPISGKDFDLIPDQATKRILGVHSPSNNISLKQFGFPSGYPDPITVQIATEQGFAKIMGKLIPVKVADTEDSTFFSNTTDTLLNTTSTKDDSEIASDSTATIKYSDWIFATTIQGGTGGGIPPGGFPPGGGIPPGGFPPGGGVHPRR